MTAQSPERIFYMGKKLFLCTEPLEEYFSKGGIRLSSDAPALLFGAGTSAVGKSWMTDCI